MSLSLSFVVPVLNEVSTLTDTLPHFERLRDDGAEVLFVDGGSTDNTPTILRESGFTVLPSEKGRAVQMNRGAHAARGDVLVFLHADSYLDAPLSAVSAAVDGCDWGFFRLRLANPRWPYRLISAAINWRSRVFKRATGDQAIFADAGFFHAQQGYREIALMEDVELSRRLRCLSKPAILPLTVISSARRWERQGVVRTVVLMWFLQIAYRVGVSPRRIHRWYQ